VRVVSLRPSPPEGRVAGREEGPTVRVMARSRPAGVRGTMGLLAQDFIGAPHTASIEDLLKVTLRNTEAYILYLLISYKWLIQWVTAPLYPF